MAPMVEFMLQIFVYDETINLYDFHEKLDFVDVYLDPMDHDKINTKRNFWRGFALRVRGPGHSRKGSGSFA